MEDTYFASGVGAVIGNGGTINITVSDCYWSGNDDIEAVGGISASSEGCTEVTDNDWSAAMSAMNAALSSTGWQYKEGEDATFPLVIASSQGN